MHTHTHTQKNRSSERYDMHFDICTRVWNVNYDAHTGRENLHSNKEPT